MRNVIDENRVRKWEAWGGVFCFLGGILAALIGSLLTVGEWIVGTPLHRWIHVAGTALFIIAIPLILFAGFCLDWAEREPKKPLSRDHLNTSDIETRRHGDGATKEEERGDLFPGPSVTASPRLSVPPSPRPTSPRPRSSRLRVSR